MNKYMHSDGANIYLDAPYMEAYIPMYYFEKSGFGKDNGNMVTAFGIFNVGFFENDKLKEMKLICVPSAIDLYCDDYETKAVELPHYDEKIPCKVIKYYKGNKVMVSGIIQDSNNAINLLNFIIGGKLPPLPYSSLIDVWYKNQNMNKVNFGVPSFILELILSVSCRANIDPRLKFCEDIGKPDSKSGDYDYKLASVRDICRYSSTFQALTFEDIDSMITTSINRTNAKITDEPTPVEAVIKM